MRVLLDECLPKKLKRELQGYEVKTVPEVGWRGKKNGELLQLAEMTFDIFITIDQNIPFQQNLTNSRLAMIILHAPDNQIETLRPLMPEVRIALPTIQPGDCIHIS